MGELRVLCIQNASNEKSKPAEASPYRALLARHLQCCDATSGRMAEASPILQVAFGTRALGKPLWVTS